MSDGVMKEQSEPLFDADARLCAQRLIDLIQVLADSRPLVIYATERALRALLLAERQGEMTGRLDTLTPEDLATVKALITHLERTREEDL